MSSSPGGRIYHVTDVQDLHEWMSRHFREHASFEEVQDDQLGEEGKWLVKVIQRETEEGKKVERNQGEKFVGVWQVVPFPDNGPRLGVDGVYMAGDTIPSSPVILYNPLDFEEPLQPPDLEDAFADEHPHLSNTPPLYPRICALRCIPVCSFPDDDILLFVSNLIEEIC